MQDKSNDFIKDLARAQVDVLKTLIEKHFPDSTEKAAWVLTLNPTYKILEAMTDADPNNADQLIEIIKEHTSKNVIPFASNEFVKVLNRIKEEKLRRLVKAVSLIPFAVGEIYTDDNPGNKQQLLTYLEAWAEDEDNQEIILELVLEPFMDKIFKRNHWIGNLIINTVEKRLDGLNIDINKDGQ